MADDIVRTAPMLPFQTRHLGLFKPEPGSEVWEPWVRANWDIIDAAINAQAEMLGILDQRNKLLRREIAALEDRLAKLEPPEENPEDE